MAAQQRQQARIAQKVAGRTTDTRSASESDKDSGFSDVASECLSSVEQTDSEEAPPTSRWCAAHNPLGCSQPRPPPLLILKNLLVDQGSRLDRHPHTHPWTLRPSFQLLPTSSQIVVFPQSVTPSKPQPTQEKSTKYLPILNAYPRIAPQPSQQLAQGSKREADTWYQNQTKKRLPGPLCSSDNDRLNATDKEINVSEESLLNEVLACSTPAQGDTGDHSVDDTRTVPFSDKPHKTNLTPLTPQQNKSQRFHNTLDVLHRSGLLSIAIKTKELARLNQATQSQLEKLQEQVSLYTKAISTNCPEDWCKLQELLAQGAGPSKEIVM